MKAAIFCGDRNWDDVFKISRRMAEVSPDVVIEGEAHGADTLSRICAEDYGIPVKECPALWERYGRGAGPIRNDEMLSMLLDYRDQGWDVSVEAFHSDITQSKGTANMLKIAAAAGVPTHITV